ncbi:transposase-like protein, IS1239 [Streptococcus pneumoniae]|uniref:IS30 family transposase n=1 Tax=Streptococcus pneumoniae TaxID=1313 RepID=UPI000B587EE0|nr:transposase-like protein, IS1239 [Streptococcus pneumoniae]
MQKNIYFVVLDLHTTDRDKIIQLFKDWTDYSAKLVEGELVKKDGQNALFPPSDTGEKVGLNPHRLTLTFGVSASFLKRMNLENKRPRLFRDLPLFPKEQLREKYTGGDIVIHACADDEQIAFHAIRNLIRKGRNAVVLLTRAKNYCLLVLTDRKSRHQIIRLIPNKSAEVVNQALKLILKQHKILSITADNGTEFNRLFDVFSEEHIYYAHPYASWERGTNENHNRLIRRWLPKGTKKMTPKEVAFIEKWINNYPKKCLDYKSPREDFWMANLNLKFSVRNKSRN